MRKKVTHLHLWLVLALLLLGQHVTTIHVATAANDGVSYLPLVRAATGAVASCEIPGQSYAKMDVNGEPVDFNAARHPEYNLGYRGYAPTNAAMQLVTLGPVHDPKAPQFATMFENGRLPTFTQGYQRYRWDYDCDCRDGTYSPWDVTVLGMRTTPGETIRTPNTGYDIGGGNEYMVLYAAPTRVTLHVGNSDELDGYVLHVEDVCVDPRLVALYERLNAAGRNELPVLQGAQPYGRAAGAELKIAVRDSGHFLDPRSRNDWWQGK